MSKPRQEQSYQKEVLGLWGGGRQGLNINKSHSLGIRLCYRKLTPKEGNSHDLFLHYETCLKVLFNQKVQIRFDWHKFCSSSRNTCVMHDRYHHSKAKPNFMSASMMRTLFSPGVLSTLLILPFLTNSSGSEEINHQVLVPLTQTIN